MKKNPRWIFLTTAFLVCMAMTAVGRASSTTTISVDPSEVKDLEPGESFTVDITVNDVTDLYGWSINLTFKPNVLNVVNVTQGPFLQQVANITPWLGQINNEIGFISPGAVLFDPVQGFPSRGATGSGVLATVNFTVKGQGVAELHFARSKLNTYVAGNNVPIDHEASDGVFRNVAPTSLSVELIIGVVGALAIVSVAVFFYVKRRT
jgi:hypothetical protein